MNNISWDRCFGLVNEYSYDKISRDNNIIRKTTIIEHWEDSCQAQCNKIILVMVLQKTQNATFLPLGCFYDFSQKHELIYFWILNRFQWKFKT